MLVPGLESALVGLKAGEVRKVVVPSEEGFGEYDDELVLEVERSEFPNSKAIAVGDEFVAESEDGDAIPMRVVEVTDDAVIVDGNHPLAGVVLHYAVTVREVRRATDDEIQKAATELEEAEDEVHGKPQKAAEAPDIVTLGKKPKLPN
jgi:FKBP-type peptidyl-prolyl cis-trans isomerase SlyD